jgi:hypothetical protein
LHSLTFPFLHSYSGQSAISIPLTLMSAPSRYVDLPAKLDTGSTYCIFDKSYSTLLGLDLYSGISQRIRTELPWLTMTNNSIWVCMGRSSK